MRIHPSGQFFPPVPARLSDRAILEATATSLGIAVLSATIATVLGDAGRGGTGALRALTMCFVTVVVQSRLVTFDMSLEEAAMAARRCGRSSR